MEINVMSEGQHQGMDGPGQSMSLVFDILYDEFIHGTTVR